MNPLAFPQSDERSITIEFDELHNEIDHIDAEILAAVVRRTELSRRVAAVGSSPVRWCTTSSRDSSSVDQAVKAGVTSSVP
ncbi:hypothetical protein ACWELP_26470, partial [Rhodococcus aetherivorans]